MHKPLTWIAAAFALGIGLGELIGIRGYILAAGCGAVCLTSLVFFGLNNKYFKLLLALWFCALGLAWGLFNQAPDSLLSARLGSGVDIFGEIQQVKTKDQLTTLQVKVLTLDNQLLHHNEGCLVYVRQVPGGAYSSGQLIRFQGIPELIPENGNPGAFSYRAYEQRQGIYTQFKPASPPEVTGHRVNYLNSAVQWFHDRATNLTLGIMPHRQAGVFLGILFGDTQDMTPGDEETFSITGVLHAFSVSGSNVAFVLFFGLTIFGFLPERIRFVATAGLIIFYSILSGAGGPVVRAAIMVLVVLMGRILGRKEDTLNSLALAALGMLVYNPRYLTDAGFQLSFAATWGLVALVPVLRPQGASILRHDLVVFPIAAQLATLPLLAFYFNQISLVGIAANILVTWFLGIILEVGLVAVSIGVLLPILGQVLLIPVLYLIKLVTLLLELLMKIPGAAIWVLTPPLWLIVAYYVVLCAWVYKHKFVEWVGFITKQFSLRQQVLAVISCLIILTSLAWATPVHRNLQVEFLDVGQGDSILISTPQGKHYLLDGGPRSDKFDTGRQIILPYLFSQGIKNLDGIMLSHTHDDHSGGLVEVVHTLPVNSFFTAAVDLQNDPGWWQTLQGELNSKRVPLYQLRVGQKLELDKDVWIQVLGPVASFSGTHSDQNNDSLVLELSYANFSVLLTGDIELEALETLKSIPIKPASIIKIPHHGSKYGLEPEFFDQLHPPLVVISVGKNSFGQPAPEISNYWDDRNIPILRTDQAGLVRVISDGNNVEVRTGRQQQLFARFTLK